MIKSGWSFPIVKAPYILVILADIAATPFVVDVNSANVALDVSVP